MQKMTQKIVPVLLAIFVLLCSSTLFAQDLETARSNALKATDDALTYIDKWINEYEIQLREADPVEKAKYQEWIKELKKLRELVLEAAEKIKECKTVECIDDQANLVGIAQQQVAQLIKEAEERLGETARFGEETGREVSLDEEIIGDNTLDDANKDPDDAYQESTAEEAKASDINESASGDLFRTTELDDLPPENPLDESSLQ